MSRRRPFLAMLFLPEREAHLTDAQYEFRRWGHWLMFGSMFSAIYSYGWEQLRETLGMGGVAIGALIGGSCAIGAAKLWRLSIETASDGGKILYRTAWFICMAVVLWGMFTLFNNGLNDSYRELQAAEDRDRARLEQADAMRGDGETLSARLLAAQQRIERARGRLERAEGWQATVERVVRTEQSQACTNNADVRAIQTAMSIEPIDGCARNITGGRVADELAQAQAEMAEATAAQTAVFEEQRANLARVASGEVAEVEFGANEAAGVGGFARFFRGVSLLAYKAEGWFAGARNAAQDDLDLVDDRAMTIGAVSLAFLAFVLDLLSPVFNSVGSRPSGREPDAPAPVPLLPAPIPNAPTPIGLRPIPSIPGAAVLPAAAVPAGYTSAPPQTAPQSAPRAAPRPEPDRARLGAESALNMLRQRNRS